MRPVVVTIHAGETAAKRIAEPLGARWRAFVVGHGSTAYDSKTGLAAEYPTLRSFLLANVPEWHVGVPLVLLCHSAGGWAGRAWMMNPGDRELVTGLILSDCLYGNPCPAGAVQGIVDFGLMAAAAPHRHQLVMTYGSYTEPCASYLKRKLPESPGVHVYAPGGSHSSHAWKHAPIAAKEWIAPIVGPLGWGKTLALVAGTAAVLAATVMLSK